LSNEVELSKNIVETGREAGSFSTLLAAVDAAGLGDTLADGAPVHRVRPDRRGVRQAARRHGRVAGRRPGEADGGIHVADANVVSADIEAANGGHPRHRPRAAAGSRLNERKDPKMERIRATLALLAVAAVAAAAMGASASASTTSRLGGDRNIVETAVAAGQFKTLASLLTKAGLADTLATGGPFTVFAPTDAAFAKVPKATLAALGKNKAKLRAVLLYHVVKGKVTAARAMKLSSADTLQGKSLSIRVNGSKVIVGGATVTKADVNASNGVIHVINKVLIP
jgi:uncharacterized surface protein with fasciclin (FAS1) repeats